MSAWFAAFVFTQLVEVPIYMAALGCSASAAFGASALTHPIVWFGFFHPSLPATYETRLASAELFAWLAEAAYFRLGWRHSRTLRRAFVANAASLGLGFLSRRWLGWP